MNYDKREDIEKDYTWDLTTRYKTDEEWEKEFLDTKKDLKSLSKFESKVMQSADNLYDTLEEYFKLLQKVIKLFVYAELKRDEDLSNNNYSLMLNKAEHLYNDLSVASAFI